DDRERQAAYVPASPLFLVATPLRVAGVLPATDRLPLVLFDGVCNLCNASVRFIIDRDPEGVFCFAPLQSDVGQAWVARHHAEADPADSVVLIDADGYHTRSTAALRIARRLS